MRSLTIEDISHKSLSIRLVGTSHVYKINLNKAVRFSDIAGLAKDELLLLGVVAGKISRNNAKLLGQYSFEHTAITGDFRLKSINFDQDVTFIKDDRNFIKIAFSELFSNVDIIEMLSDELSFYIGFLYGIFSLTSDELILGSHPKPYLAVESHN